MEMKGGDHFRLLTGKHLYLAVLALLICLAISIWGWDRNPFLSTTYVSAQNQCAAGAAASTAFPPTAPAPESMEPEMKTDEEKPESPGEGGVKDPEENVDNSETSNPSVNKDGDLKNETSNNSEAPNPSANEDGDLKNETSSSESVDNSEAPNPSANGDGDLKNETSSSENVDNSETSNPSSNEDGDLKNETSSSENVDNSETSNPSSNEDGDLTHETSSSVETKVCNYAKGRWVADSRPTFYHACKYVQRNWDCRITNRTDFSYENYRWQSIDCKMPEFEPSDFLKKMKDKTIAFIGDSLSREQFQSMMCMLTGGQDSPDVEDVADKYNFLLILRNGATHHNGWAYRFKTTNTTILHTWSTRLCDRQPINASDPHTLYAMHLDRQPIFIRDHIDQLGVLVINTAHHWSRQMVNLDNEVMYLNGQPVRDKHLLNIGNARAFKVNNIVKWLDSQLALHPNLQVFFRTASPKHLFKVEWNTWGSCNNLVPMSRGNEVLLDESMDKVVAAAVNGTMVKLLDITALSDLRDEAHISHYGRKANDCVHWCLPGVPDTWNEILSALV